MLYRGPILIAFAASLVASPIAMRLLQDDTPRISLVGASQLACSERGVDTFLGRLGCAQPQNTRTRTLDPSGALFVRH